MSGSVFHFIIPRNNGKTSMMTNSCKIFIYFRFNVVKHFLVVGDIHTCKHQIGKNHKTEFVAYIKKFIVRIKSSSPYSYCIKITIRTMLQKLFGTAFCNTRKNVILRNIIGTHSEKSYTVNFVTKAFAVFVFLSY